MGPGGHIDHFRKNCDSFITTYRIFKIFTAFCHVYRFKKWPRVVFKKYSRISWQSDFVIARGNKLVAKQISINSSAAAEQIFSIFSGNVRSSVRASVGSACISLLSSTIPVQCLVRAWRWARRLMHGFRASPLFFASRGPTYSNPTWISWASIIAFEL